MDARLPQIGCFQPFNTANIFNPTAKIRQFTENLYAYQSLSRIQTGLPTCSSTISENKAKPQPNAGMKIRQLTE